MPSPTVKLETIKTLVALHGQRKAARIAGLNENTVRTWAMRFKWKTAKAIDAPKKPDIENTIAKVHNQITTAGNPASVVIATVEAYRQRSKTNLAQYVAEASTEAVQTQHKLAITRKAKDLADIHSTLFPESSESKQILNLQIVTGQYVPNDQPSH